MQWSKTACPRDLTHKGISDSVTYYHLVQQTISRCQNIVGNARKELETLLSQQPSMVNIWSTNFRSSILSSEACISLTRCSILVCGVMNSCKTSLVRDLLRNRIRLPCEDCVCTRLFTVVRYGTNDVVRLMLKSEICKEEEIQDDEPHSSFIRCDDDEDDPQQHVEIDLNYDLLKCGLQVIDTPGLNENETTNDIFMDRLRQFQPLIIIFAFNGIQGFGENDTKFVARILNTLDDLKYDYSLMFAANKIDGDPVAERIDDLSGKFLFEENKPREEILRLFSRFDNVKIHGLSHYVMEDHEGRKLKDDKCHFIQRYYQFEMDIAGNINSAAMKILENNLTEVKTLNHDLHTLKNITLSTQQDLNIKRQAVDRKDFPTKLIDLHKNLLGKFNETFEQNWKPLSYEEDLVNLCKSQKRDENLVNMMEYLIDRAVNVIANTIHIVFLSSNKKDECEHFTNLCQDYLPLSMSHNQCVLKLMTTQSKLATIREECARLMKILLGKHDWVNLSFKDFIQNICQTTCRMTTSIKDFIEREMNQEVESMRESIQTWSHFALAKEKILDFSMTKLNSLINKTAVINLALSYVKELQPDEMWNEIHELKADFPSIQDGHTWLMHLDSIHRTKHNHRFFPDDFTLVQACLLDYSESPNNVKDNDDVSCTFRIQWRMPPCRPLIDVIHSMRSHDKTHIMKCLLNIVKSNVNDPSFHYFCIHSLNVVNDCSSSIIVYNPYLPPFHSAEWKKIELEPGQVLRHDCWNESHPKKRLLRTFLHIYLGCCNAEEVDTALNPSLVNERLQFLFRHVESPSDEIKSIFDDILMLD